MYFSFLPNFEKINNLTKKYEDLEQKLAAAKRNASQLETFRKKMKEAEIKFKIAKKELPEKEDISSLLNMDIWIQMDSPNNALLYPPLLLVYSLS